MEKINYDSFVNRHVGVSENDVKKMCKEIGVNSLDELIDKTVPKQIRLKEKLKIDSPLTEAELLSNLESIASQNKVFKSYIGLGY